MTDNAGNMQVACRDLKVPRVPCFSHTLQLAIEDSLKAHALIQNAISEAKKVVSFFHRSSKASTALKGLQEEKGVTPLVLIQDVATRWNSQYLMMDRILKLKLEVITLLHDKEIVKPVDRKNLVDDLPWGVMEDIVPILAPLAQATELLTKEAEPTCGSVYPVILGLLNGAFAQSSEDSPVAAALKETLTSSIASRFNIEEDYSLGPQAIESLYIKAAAFDPRYKSLKFLNENQRTLVQESVKEELMNTDILDNLDDMSQMTDVTVKNEPQEKSGEPQNLMFSLIRGDVIDLTQPSPDKEMEYSGYQSEPVRIAEPLVWWRVHEKSYPTVAKLAKKYLAVPATEVASERIFSTAGNTVTKKRASLDPDTVDQIVFLNKNTVVPEPVYSMSVTASTASTAPSSTSTGLVPVPVQPENSQNTARPMNVKKEFTTDGPNPPLPTMQM